ncbi:MAG TPA: NAD(P)-dependent oxidoreductase [Nitrospiraceae bacterium]|nr:NAD(P)-dependent oxidoreductase [Nitrospiraceae bacterium]
MKTGFIGLGHLGKAIARRLISEGTELVVWNRTREKAAELGVKITESPSGILSETDRVIINLFDSDAVNEIITGKGGLLEGDCKGKIIIDTTTNHFDRVAIFHDILKKHGAYYLESPVLGSVVPASLGKLIVLVSGEKAAYENVKPLLEKIGTNIFYLEKRTLATKMKLINNLVLGVFMTALTEATVFGEDAGIDKEIVLDILSAGAGNSAVLNAKKEKILKEDFSTHFSSALIYKDLHYMQDLARSLKRPLFTGSFAKELFGMTFAKKTDGLDLAGVYNIMKEYSSD